METADESGVELKPVPDSLITKAVPIGIKWLLRGVLASFAVVAIVGIFIAVRLSQGPIDLSFLKPQLAAALSESAGSLEATAREFSFQAIDGRLGIMASDLEARTNSGALVARADQAMVRLSIAHLLRGDIQATRLTVTGGALIAVRDAQGKLTLRAIDEFDKPRTAKKDAIKEGATDLESVDILELTRTWLNADHPGVDPPDLQLIDAVVIAQDGVTGEELWRGQLDAAATLTPGVILMRGTFDFDERFNAQPLQLSATLERKVGASAEVIATEADLAVLTRTLRLVGMTMPLIDGTFTGSATVKLSSNLKPLLATMKFEGIGIEASLEGGARLAFEQVSLDAKADAATKRLTIMRLRLGDPKYGLVGAGIVEPQPTIPGQAAGFIAKGRIDHADAAFVANLFGKADVTQGIDGDFAADFDASFTAEGLTSLEAKLSAKARVEKPDLFNAPVDINRIGLFAAYTPAKQELRVTGLDMRFEGVPIAGEAVIGLQQGALDTIAASLRVGAFPSERLTEIWPKTFSKGGREWVRQYLTKGKVDGADIKISKKSDGDVEAKGRFTASGLNVVYWDKMPPATDVVGIGSFEGGALNIIVNKGRSAGMNVKKVSIDFINLGAKNERIKIDGSVNGSASNLLTLLERPPLHYAKWLGVDPKLVSGSVDARLKIAFPLIDALKLDHIAIDAHGVIRDAELPGVVNGWDLAADQLEVTLNKSRLDVSGAGLLLDQPIDFKGFVRFAKHKEQARFSGSWQLTPDVRRTLGLGGTAIRRRLTGITPTKFVVSALSGQDYLLDMDANLVAATLLAQEIGWLKPKGTPARLKARLMLIDGKPRNITNLRLIAPDMDIEASVKFRPDDGRVESVIVHRLAGAGNNLRLTYTAQENGDQVLLSGKQADIRPLFDLDGGKQSTAANAETGPGKPLHIDVDVDRVRVSKTFWLNAMRGQMTLVNAWPVAVDATASYPGGQLAIRPSSDVKQQLLATATDFGALLRATGATNAAIGGTARIHASKTPKGALALDFKAKGFALLKAELAALTGDDRQSPLLRMLGNSDNVPFQRMDVLGEWQSGVLAISKGRAFGNALGVTAQGTVDVNGDKLNLQGAASPAYGVSRAIGSIPILGALLTGSKKEGVFAANYRVSGLLSDPAFDINPLSALAPGILREIFDSPSPRQSAEAPTPADEREDP